MFIKDEDSLFGLQGRYQVWSLDMPMTGASTGGSYNYTFADYVSDLLHKQEGANHIEVTKHFSKFIVANYQMILTPKQVEYLEAPGEDRNHNYKKNTRWNYRKRIQESLMLAYFGSTVTMTRRLNVYLDGMIATAHLLIQRDWPDAFTHYVISNIDSNYINTLVYERLDTDMRKEVVRAYKDKTYSLSNFTINTICEFAEDDSESFKTKVSQTKKN